MSRPAYSTSVLVEASSAEIGLSAVYGTLTIGNAVASEVKIGASALEGRTALMIQADEDNAGSVYLGFGATAPTTANACYRLSGGAGVILTLDKFNAITVKAIASVAGQKIHVTELK